MNSRIKLLLLFLGIALSARADTSIVFNEIMCPPATGGAATQWIEIHNQMAVDVDVSGWALAGAVTYTFPSNSIIHGGGFAVVAASPAALISATGLTNVFGPFAGLLSNTGGLLQMINNNGRVVDQLTYAVGGDWPVAPGGAGVSLAKRDSETASDVAANWTASAQVGGTPGAANFSPAAQSFPATQLIATDSSWKFNPDGANFGTSWRASNFSDATWPTGQAWFCNSTTANGVTLSLPTLFNTGVDQHGDTLISGVADPHFTMTAEPLGLTNINALAIDNHPEWLPNNGTSSWICVAEDSAVLAAAGNYKYTTHFSLAGFVPTSVRINLNFCVDDVMSEVLLNGSPLGITDGGYAAFSGPFAITNGFLPGTNTLELQTVNTSPGPTGLLVEFSSSGLFTPTNSVLPAGATTYLFRKEFFNTNDPASVQLKLNALVTDGAVFYLNGAEVLRLNLPAGVIDFSTPALTTVTNPTFTGLIPLVVSNLVAGTNVLAVEVHSATGRTDGLLFAAELDSQAVAPAPINLAFNEISATTNAAFWLELMNFGTNDLSLAGFAIACSGHTNVTYQFPINTTLAAGNFLALTNDTLGFQPANGDALYLFDPTRTHVLDAVLLRKNLQGRSPDGTGNWLFPGAPTAGGSNIFALHHEIVINEIMYHHRDVPATNGLPAQTSPEAWIELYNRGSNSVDLTGWTLSDGITFSFAAGQTIPAGGYLVVAKNAAYLRALYPSITIVGNFGKNLSHSSDRIILNDASGNPANVVRYYDDGRWAGYADGGGSSLELRDPNADNSTPGAWAASDETSKSVWQTVSYSAVAQTIVGPEQWNDFVLGLLSEGECLIDDLSVLASPTNHPIEYIANGNFESNSASWRMVGDHSGSRIEVDPDNPTNHVLHVVATRAQEHMNNHIETTFANGLTVTNGQTYQISYRARWLAGNNLLNTRLYFDRVAKTTALAVPALNGTPGAINSRFTPNLGPTFSQFQHSPVVPQPSQPVTVSIFANDPQGVSACEIWWSVNGGNFSSATMTNQGGGFYTGIIPGYRAGTLVQFFVRAVDSLGAATTYPAAGTNSGALYVVNDGQANFAMGHNLRILLSPANRSLLYAFTNLMSNDNLPCTVIQDEQKAYYDMGVRLKGSERGRPSGAQRSFHLEFQPDDLFRGVHPVMLVDRSGIPDSDLPPQEEIIVRHMLLHAGDIPGTQPDLCKVIAPFNDETGSAILSPRHEDEFIDTAYANGGDGIEWEYEMIYFPLTADEAGYKNPQPDDITGPDITDLGDDPETYRYDFIIKNHRDADDNSRLVSFAKTFSLPAGPALSARLGQLVDLDEWLRAYALISLCGVSDSYTFGNNHNLLLYLRPADQKMVAFPWDMDHCFLQDPSAPLIGNRNWGEIESQPANLRRAYAHALDLIATTYNTGYMSYWISHYAGFLPGQDFTPVLSYIPQRTAAVLSEISAAGGNTPFSVSATNLLAITNNLITITGTAPVQLQSLSINGVSWPLTWTTVSTWSLQIPVTSPTNSLVLAGYDLHGNPLGNSTATVTVNYLGSLSSPVGSIAINEILCNPALPGAGYVELLNTSPTTSFDLSGWTISELGYTFPPGCAITNNQYLVLAENASSFATAFGSNTWAFDVFSGTLPVNAGTLTLVRPGTNAASNLTITKVKYQTSSPWPATPPNTALQLIDPTQDNWRAGNWATVLTNQLATFTPGSSNSVNQSLASFPPLWLNELEADNLTGITNRAGQRTGWLELYNPTTNLVALDGLYLANNYTNLTQWSFPAGTVINPGQFKVIFADGLTNLSTPTELHTSFSLPSGSGSLALTSLSSNTGLQVLDFIDYTNLTPNHSYGSYPDGQSFLRQEFFVVNAGGTNSPQAAPITIFINEWMADNKHTITNPYLGGYDDWFELYNPGTNAVNLGGYYLTGTLSNPTKFKIPATGQYLVPAGGFMLVWADNNSGQNSPGRPELHVNFALSKNGDAIGLFTSNGVAIDAVTFGAQATDVSQGRFPDGAANIFSMPTPTPQASNIIPNHPPIIVPPGSHSVFVGQTLSFLVSATDTDQPPQTLTWSLDPGAPTNALINSVSGLFSWTPLPGQAPASYSIAVRVTDNGTPPQSAAQTFTVNVLLSSVTLTSSWSGSSLILTWPQGILLRATDLSGPWIALTNTSPYVIIPRAPQEFFRVVVSSPILYSSWSGASLSLLWPQGTLLEASNLAGPWIALTNSSPFAVTLTAPQKFYRVLLQ